MRPCKIHLLALGFILSMATLGCSPSAPETVSSANTATPTEDNATEEPGAPAVEVVTLVFPRADDLGDCSARGEATREVAASSDAPARAEVVLRALLAGPTEEEQTALGVHSPFDATPSVPQATDLLSHLTSVTMDGATVVLDFARPSEMFFGQAVCPAGFVTSSIENTLVGLDGIDSVRITVEGQPPQVEGVE